METLGVVLAVVGFSALSAGVVNNIWRGVLRRREAWWMEHCERVERETGASLKRMSVIAEAAIDLNTRYREYLSGKIILEDPSKPKPERGRA
jgi:hypothetical protein